jgi:Metallopeptidase family M24
MGDDSGLTAVLGEMFLEDEMSINEPEELAGMRAAGVVVQMMLEAMRTEVRPGITTAQLDEVGGSVMRQHGAQSAPALVYGFPGVSCISLNEEAVHGIPGERALQSGDLVKLDVTIEKDGFMADAALTVPVGEVTEERRKLVACAGGLSGLGDWTSGGARGPAQRILGDSRPRGARHWAHHSRRTSGAQLSRSRSESNTHRRPGDYGRTNYCSGIGPDFRRAR